MDSQRQLPFVPDQQNDMDSRQRLFIQEDINSELFQSEISSFPSQFLLAAYAPNNCNNNNYHNCYHCPSHQQPNPCPLYSLQQEQQEQLKGQETNIRQTQR